MLGEMIGEDRGKITAMRVLPSQGQGPVVEVSFQAAGKLLGVDTTDIGTYVSTLTSAGIFHGEGQGMLSTKDGDILTWKGTGVGQPKGKGFAASWRGTLYFQTNSTRLAKINDIAVVFEHEVDENGNLQTKLWEWK